jgi:anti-sigma-K factor RskA
MNEYTCRDIDEMLVGYAADALEESQRCAVSEHLAECRRHDTELTAVRGDLERLAVSVSPVEPPDRLRSRLLSAFDEAVASPEPAPVSITTAPSAAKRGLFSTSGFAYAVAAAMLALAIGLGAWGLSRDDGGGNEDVIVAQSSQSGASMQVTYVPSEKVAVMDVNLPALPPGRVYQAWRIDGGAPVSLGVVETNSGSVAMHADLEGATAVAISVEPTGGSSAPTTNPVLVAEL